MKRYFYYLLILGFINCIDPIEPQFDYKENLIYVDAFLSTTPNTSFVTISESFFIYEDRLAFNLIKGATVSYINLTTEEVIFLQEDVDAYYPPLGFMASEGEMYELHITLEDGRKYWSEPEKVTSAVDIQNISYSYNPEITYREESESYVPGHHVLVDVDDPEQDNNYYFYRFRSFENLKFCASCHDGIYRSEECIDNPYDPRPDPYFNYLCETDCWKIRLNENIKLFSDSFSNGNLISNIIAGDVLLYSKENILVEVQQYSLSEQAYQYYRIIKDLVDNNSGLNAPPPAALVGNMYNPDNKNEYVLGRFTAAASSKRSVFIDRSEIQDNQIDPVEKEQLETMDYVCPNPPPPFAPPCNPVIRVACMDDEYRTSIEPEGWIR